MTTTPPADRQPHQSKYVGRYRLVQRVGRGAMGVVYHARDEVMNRDVALKVMSADVEDDPEVRTRFRREAEAAARLSHPNIITIFDVGEDGDQLFIVMELLRGASLKHVVAQREVVPLARNVDLMIQLCSGLGAAHRAHICHRDIKPGNLFVRTDGLLKILDFGVARLATSSMTGTGFIVGTPDYMSPEQARGHEVDGRSDIFSAGGVCYFMLTGRKPFQAPNLPALFDQIQHVDPEPMDAIVPGDLGAVVLKALAKDRETRYQSCEEFLSDLEAVRSRHSLDLPHASGTNPFTDTLGSSGPAGSLSLDARPTASQTSTEDTVDSVPVGIVDPDDTVSLEPETPWTVRVATRLDSALSGAFARLGRGTSAPSTRETGTRKRES